MLASEEPRSNSQALKSLGLDLGCGPNPRNVFNADRVIGIDSQCDTSGIINCWVGFEPMPLEDSCIDFVTAFDFIEHIPRFAMGENNHSIHSWMR